MTPVKEPVPAGNGITIKTLHEIETPYYRIKLNNLGQFTSIFDKEAQREVLKPNGLGNVLRVYEDKPIYYDNWDIDIYYTQKSWVVDDLKSAEWIENGPVRIVLRLIYRFCESDIVQDVIFIRRAAELILRHT